jgi:hypothetical protein
LEEAVEAGRGRALANPGAQQPREASPGGVSRQKWLSP